MVFNRKQRERFFSFLICVSLVGLIGCSKKDVVSDEQGMAPSEDSSGMAAPQGGGVDMMGAAGDVGRAAGEMDIVYYGYDSFTLSDEARSALKKNADWMKANTNSRVQIEGHCDERGTVEYNMALGDRRANAAKAYLVRLGVAANRIETISYGKERPADMGHSESAWSKNRRAVFVLLSK